MSGPTRIVVHPPTPSGGRWVTDGAETLGIAHGIADVIEFLTRDGVDLRDAELDDPDLIEWQGGGPGHWLP
ncbi:hypothetical protein BLA24_15310 [Streptomyces cinnamoneus]|uniref:Uncharacterized protein n=1 Tax=Streptomyces cinnamoneus TaxID=53446 RepID=A0A2G1XIQ8_STRCJ|nr:hypothetical protein [Streptomyces cinnamoneus]PHQ51138.1 hypothetical protein BLA24_15310 [Streptomyces cinnamoneus]PPT13640.1 hypothetical protein CYQ11_12760 [Streptomyces cinnamoneus]